MTNPPSARACRCCGAWLNAVMEHEGKYVFPIAGDISICFRCGDMAVFLEDLSLEPMTPALQAEFKVINPEQWHIAMQVQTRFKLRGRDKGYNVAALRDELQKLKHSGN